MPYKPNLRQPYPNELYHFGILGQKWGVRRFQNSDGSYTAAGKKRYSSGGKNKGLFSKKKPENKVSEKKAPEISEEEKAFTEAVEKAGFKKEHENDILGRSVTFSKNGFNKKDPLLEMEIEYNENKEIWGESNPNKAIQKANRYAKDSDKIISNCMDEIVNNEYDRLTMFFGYKYPDEPIPSKKEMKAFLTPLVIDSTRDLLVVEDDISEGWFDVEFNPETYKAYRAAFSD